MLTPVNSKELDVHLMVLMRLICAFVRLHLGYLVEILLTQGSSEVKVFARIIPSTF